jgi:hypothetical protein
VIVRAEDDGVDAGALATAGVEEGGLGTAEDVGIVGAL